MTLDHKWLKCVGNLLNGAFNSNRLSGFPPPFASSTQTYSCVFFHCWSNFKSVQLQQVGSLYHPQRCISIQSCAFNEVAVTTSTYPTVSAVDSITDQDQKAPKTAENNQPSTRKTQGVNCNTSNSYYTKPAVWRRLLISTWVTTNQHELTTALRQQLYQAVSIYISSDWYSVGSSNGPYYGPAQCSACICIPWCSGKIILKFWLQKCI